MVGSLQTAHDGQRPHLQIAPWVHYIQIHMSYTDLYNAMSFFRVYDELGRQIAQEGWAWSQQFWRREDMMAYVSVRDCVCLDGGYDTWIRM